MVDLRKKINEGRDAWDIIVATKRDRGETMRDIDDSDHFPVFTRNIINREYP